MARVIAGDVNPAGRLPVTFYRSASDLPPFEDYGMQGRTYRYFDRPVLYAFGHGLSYTRFAYAEPRVSRSRIRPTDTVEASVVVTNTGDRAGREVVQLSFRDPVAQVTRPVIELVDWVALDLGPGERGTASFTVRAEQFAYYGRENVLRLDPGEIVLSAGPDSLHGSPLSITITPKDP